MCRHDASASPRRLKRLQKLWMEMDAPTRAQALSEFSLPLLSSEGLSTARLEELIWKRMRIPNESTDLATSLYRLTKAWPEQADAAVLHAGRLADELLKTGRLMHRRIETPKGAGIIMAIERLLTGSIRERVQDLMSTEDLIIESFKDIVKDELKAHIRNKIEEDPDLHAEIKEAVAYYFHQRHVPSMLNSRQPALRLDLVSDFS